MTRGANEAVCVSAGYGDLISRASNAVPIDAFKRGPKIDASLPSITRFTVAEWTARIIATVGERYKRVFGVVSAAGFA